MKTLLALVVAAAVAAYAIPSFAADGDATGTTAPKALTKEQKAKNKEEKAKAKPMTKEEKAARNKAKQAEQAETLKNQEQTRATPTTVDKSVPKQSKAERAEANKQESKNPGKGQ